MKVKSNKRVKLETFDGHTTTEALLPAMKLKTQWAAVKEELSGTESRLLTGPAGDRFKKEPASGGSWVNAPALIAASSPTFDHVHDRIVPHDHTPAEASNNGTETSHVRKSRGSKMQMLQLSETVIIDD